MTGAAPVLSALPTPGYELRPLASTDLETTRLWRNHPNSARWFDDNQYIAPESQRRWFDARSNIKDDLIFLLWSPDGQRVGQFSVYNMNHTARSAEVGRFLIAPELRGTGLFAIGFSLLRKFCEHSLGLDRLFLRVKANNLSAIRAYVKVGFEELHRINGDVEMEIALCRR